MKTFDWADSYSVKVERFDRQHKHLFEIVKRLYAAMEKKTEKQELEKVLAELIYYSKEHFIEEEICLLNTQYPDYLKHKKHHKQFIEKIEKFSADYYSDKPLLHLDVLVFLKNWVLQHILVVDKSYGEYLNSKGIF